MSLLSKSSVDQFHVKVKTKTFFFSYKNFCSLYFFLLSLIQIKMENKTRLDFCYIVSCTDVAMIQYAEYIVYITSTYVNI